LEAFLCYSHLAKERAGKVGLSFEKSGCVAFRAHDNIKPDKEWVREIFKHLDSCSALIAIITPGFLESSYANQEVGYVLRRGKPIISFHFGGELPGFLNWRQAISVADNTIDDAVAKSIRLIAEREGASPQQPPSIALQNDAIFEKRVEPYRRVAIIPENANPDLIPMTPENEDWLLKNRPLFLGDWFDEQPTQFGLVFDSRSGHYGEIVTDGQLYYGERFPAQDGVQLFPTVRIVAEVLEWAAKVYSRFGLIGGINLEFRTGLIRGLELANEPGRVSLVGKYETKNDPVVVSRALSSDFEQHKSSHLISILMEFCRAFGFRMNEVVAKERVQSVLEMR